MAFLHSHTHTIRFVLIALHIAHVQLFVEYGSCNWRQMPAHGQSVSAASDEAGMRNRCWLRSPCRVAESRPAMASLPPRVDSPRDDSPALRSSHLCSCPAVLLSLWGFPACPSQDVAGPRPSSTSARCAGPPDLPEQNSAAVLSRAGLLGCSFALRVAPEQNGYIARLPAAPHCITLCGHHLPTVINDNGPGNEAGFTGRTSRR